METPLYRVPTVFTIHNLAFQGVFDGGGFYITGLPRELYNPSELEHFGAMNLMKGALAHATLLSTVSPTYAEEIHRPEHGAGLDGIIASRRSDVNGILNGIDPDEWNPATIVIGQPDTTLSTSRARRSAKSDCRRKPAFRRDRTFPSSARSDVSRRRRDSTTSRGQWIDFSNGICRWFSWARAMRDAEEFFSSLSSLRGDKFRARIGFDNGLAHRIEAGCDFFVMPSRFEPCGLNQLYSLRYGTPPIVHATGGLADTVANYDETSGTGFVSHRLDAESLANTVGWALSTYFDRPAHLEAMRRRGMAMDFSWARAASRYEELYREARRRRNA